MKKIYILVLLISFVLVGCKYNGENLELYDGINSDYATTSLGIITVLKNFYITNDITDDQKDNINEYLDTEEINDRQLNDKEKELKNMIEELVNISYSENIDSNAFQKNYKSTKGFIGYKTYEPSEGIDYTYAEEALYVLEKLKERYDGGHDTLEGVDLMAYEDFLEITEINLRELSPAENEIRTSIINMRDIIYDLFDGGETFEQIHNSLTHKLN